jgi:hypothetical protein
VAVAVYAAGVAGLLAALGRSRAEAG